MLNLLVVGFSTIKKNKERKKEKKEKEKEKEKRNVLEISIFLSISPHFSFRSSHLFAYLDIMKLLIVTTDFSLLIIECVEFIVLLKRYIKTFECIIDNLTNDDYLM